MTEFNPLGIALTDAANNCHRDGATATVTLKSGVQLVGKLDKLSGADLGTRHISTDGGWVTFLTDEVAAVGAEPRRQRF